MGPAVHFAAHALWARNSSRQLNPRALAALIMVCDFGSFRKNGHKIICTMSMLSCRKMVEITWMGHLAEITTSLEPLRSLGA